MYRRHRDGEEAARQERRRKARRQTPRHGEARRGSRSARGDAAGAQGRMIRWTKGGDATIVAMDGDRVTLDSSLSSPPGSLIDGTLVNGGGAIRIKVRGCKK